jgi:hypothetical protein
MLRIYFQILCGIPILLVTIAVGIGIGIVIGHFAINKDQTPATWKYDRLTRQADQQNYKTFINSIQADNIEDNLR